MLIILSGPVSGGKTSFLRERCSDWEKAGPPLRGFLSLTLREGGNRIGYDLYPLPSGPSFPFLRLTGGADWERVGPFFAVPKALRKALSIVRGAVPGELLIVDEVGPLEIQGRGFWPALEEVLRRPSAASLLVIRKEILDSFLLRLEDLDPHVVDIKEPGAALRLDHIVAEAGALR